MKVFGGALGVFNTGPGGPSTSDYFTGRLITPEVQISMDGRGSALDNGLVERLWLSVKYESLTCTMTLMGVPPIRD